MALQDTHNDPSNADGPVNWYRLASRARTLRRIRAASVYLFLLAVSLPILLPYFWLTTVAFSSKRGIAETDVLWRSLLILVPAVIALWLAVVLARNRRQMWTATIAILVITTVTIVRLIGPDLHVGNFIFLW